MPLANLIVTILTSLVIIAVTASVIKGIIWPSEETKAKEAAERAKKEAADTSGTIYGKNPHRYRLTIMFGLVALGLSALSYTVLSSSLSDGLTVDTAAGLAIAAATVFFYYVYFGVIRNCWRECERRANSGVPVNQD